jgi:hypothetical protein
LGVVKDSGFNNLGCVQARTSTVKTCNTMEMLGEELYGVDLA